MSTLVPDIIGADPMAAALLIECRGRDGDALQASIDEVRGLCVGSQGVGRRGQLVWRTAGIDQPFAGPGRVDATKSNLSYIERVAG